MSCWISDLAREALIEPCGKPRCLVCQHNVRINLDVLAHNLAVAGALQESWVRGVHHHSGFDGLSRWYPGCKL